MAGTIAASYNGQGVVGMATNAQLIPIKVLDSTGFGTDAQVICGLDYIAALAQSQPGPYVVNMSLGDSNRPGETTCSSSALHQAICNLTNAGVTVVAAAGNDGSDAASFVPAAYDEVIAVSAFTDFDGQRSSTGCQLDFSDYGYQCDDTLADFSNYGSVIDVTAPGVHVLSDSLDGGQQTLSGTSMAAPHVAGAAALVLGANPSLTPAQVRALLETTGECPDGSVAGAPTCAGHGQWTVGGFSPGPDKDGIPEPLINALRAAQAAGNAPPPPVDTQPDFSLSASPASLTVAQGSNGSTTINTTAVNAPEPVSLAVTGLPSGVTASFTPPSPVTSGGSTALTLAVGRTAAPGTSTLTITGTASSGGPHTATVTLTISPPPPYMSAPQGSWVNTYGSAGYVLAGWNNGGSDLTSLGAATVSLDQGSRWCWTCSTTDVRALQNPSQTQRRAATYADPNQVTVHLSFPSAYSGTLHLYAVDWDSTARRESITVNDGSGPHTVNITADFSQGAWTSFPVTVASGGTVTITVTRTAGINAVLSGIFLGDAGPPYVSPPPPPPPYMSAPQGSWVNTYGSAGYVLAGWNNGGSDLTSLGAATVSLDQGSRWCWTCSTTDVRALQNPSQTQRRAATYADPNQVTVHLSFPSAYSGTLHLYAVDWDSTARRESITVNDGSGPHTVNITADFSQGAWTSFPVTVASGGTVTITVTRTAGINAVLSGIFLGDAGPPYVSPPPPPPPYMSAPQGSWVNTYGSAGYVLAGWNNGGSDLTSLGAATVSLDQGSRWCWTCSTTDVRALQNPSQTQRRAATYADPNQVTVHLSFPSAYSGTLHLYAVDWDSTARRESITVNDGSGPHTVNITADFSQGAWTSFPVTVASGGTVTITVTRTAGINAVLSGIFLGDAGPPYVSPPPPPPPYMSAPQGSWVNTYGSAGYVLAGWNNGGSDLTSLGAATVSLDQGSRWCWTCSTTDVRALQNPSQTQRRAATYADPNQVTVHLSFPSAYSGTLHLYAVDWDSTARRESITVNDGSGPHTVNITADFSQGAWTSFPVTVASGGTVTITVTRTAGINAVLSGIFLD